MSLPRGRILYALVGACWATAVAFGLARLWNYESTPGTPAAAPSAWPADAHVPRTPGLPTLILLVHPRCPCSRATLGELAAIMTDCRGKLSATVLMLRPTGEPDGWERTDLWNQAAAIPGVAVASDPGGADARRFGAATSGQALLYAPDGRLLFAGGLTGSRGHSGANPARATVTALLLGIARPAAAAPPATAAVYGCPLSDDPTACPTEGSPTCPIR